MTIISGKDCKGYSGFPTWDAELQYRIKPEEDEQWKPKEGETYYFLVSTGAVVKEHFQPSWPGDNARLEIGNCFRTREEAVSAIPHVKAALKGKNVNVSANVSGNVDSNAGSPEIDGKPLTHIEKEAIRKFRAGVPFPEAEFGTWRALSPGEDALVRAMRKAFDKHFLVITKRNNDLSCHSCCIASPHDIDEEIRNAINRIQKEQKG